MRPTIHPKLINAFALSTAPGINLSAARIRALADMDRLPHVREGCHLWFDFAKVQKYLKASREAKISQKRTQKHVHMPQKGKARTVAYVGEIAGATPNLAARGGDTVIDQCSCGAKRWTNIRGDERERGPWIGGKVPKRTVEVGSEVLEEVETEVKALGEKRTKGNRAITEKYLSALKRNAKLAGRPRGIRIEDVVEERFVAAGDVENLVETGMPVLVRLIKITTPGGKRTWEFRCSYNGEVFRYVPSTTRPDFESFCGSK